MFPCKVQTRTHLAGYHRVNAPRFGRAPTSQAPGTMAGLGAPQAGASRCRRPPEKRAARQAAARRSVAQRTRCGVNRRNGMTSREPRLGARWEVDRGVAAAAAPPELHGNSQTVEPPRSEQAGKLLQFL